MCSKSTLTVRTSSERSSRITTPWCWKKTTFPRQTRSWSWWPQARRTTASTALSLTARFSEFFPRSHSSRTRRLSTGRPLTWARGSKSWLRSRWKCATRTRFWRRISRCWRSTALVARMPGISGASPLSSRCPTGWPTWPTWGQMTSSTSWGGWRRRRTPPRESHHSALCEWYRVQLESLSTDAFDSRTSTGSHYFGIAINAHASTCLTRSNGRVKRLTCGEAVGHWWCFIVRQ